MKIVFKTITIIVIAVAINMTANAQSKGDKAVGGNLISGIGEYHSIGIGAKLLYNVTNPIRLAVEFDCASSYTLCSGESWWDLSAYGHSLFPVANRVVLYPSFGLGIVGWNRSNEGAESSGNNFAASFGGGIDYALSSHLVLNSEIRFKLLIDDYNRANIAIGLAYKF